MADLDTRRLLPSVEALLQRPDIQALSAHAASRDVTAAVREALARARRQRGGAPESWPLAVADILREQTPALLPVLNATGIVLHTNLGRAPLAPAAITAMTAVAAGYSTLEYDLATGARGGRADHARQQLAQRTGANDGLVVNNAAGALVLALNALAEGREVIISRGELIEIGGSFRIPDILLKSGARLREVGTTNRTHLTDYASAIGAETGAILTVHRSNFEQRGFVGTPAPAALAALAHRHGLPYIHDVGSGLLADLSPWDLDSEPGVADAVAAGADLVLFSGDKLLGGPQSGCLVGTRAAIEACRTNPLARALRADKLSLAALTATLQLYADPVQARQEIPVLRMLTATPTDLARRAQRLLDRCPPLFSARLLEGASAVGGGAFPGAVLCTTLVALTLPDHSPDWLALRLRRGSPPIIARILQGQVVLDPRTLPEDADDLVSAALLAVEAELRTNPA